MSEALFGTEFENIPAKETVVATITGIEEMTAEKQEEKLTTDLKIIANTLETLTIVNEQGYQEAADLGRMLKKKEAEVKAYWKPMKDAAHQAHTKICDREKAMLQPLTDAQARLKMLMTVFAKDQARKQREAEEQARLLAQQEAEKKLAEAVEHEANGNAEAAQAAMEEAEIMDDAAADIVLTAIKPKAQGVSTRRDWQITSVDNDKVPMSIAGVMIRPVDMAAVMRLVRTSKGTIEIPGIEYTEVSNISFRQ